MADGADLLYITSHPHSGSTLLDVVLGGHPEVVGTGEVHRLSLAPGERLCTCRNVLTECPFWTRVAFAIAGEETDDLERFWTEFPVTVDNPKKSVRYLPDLLELALILQSRVFIELLSWFDASAEKQLRIASNSWQLYEAVSRIGGAQYVVDSTKNLLRLKLLHHHRPGSVRVIQLVRRPEAIAASARRRRDTPVDQTLRSWVHWRQKTAYALAGIAKNAVLKVQYEDLCQSTESELRRICNFLGVDYVEEMQDLNEGRQHQVPGNPMLFQQDNRKIRYDKRWETELSSDEINRCQHPCTWFDRWMIQGAGWLRKLMSAR